MLTDLLIIQSTREQVNYEIVELVDFSGREASVYSLIPLGEEETLFERFVGEYEVDFRDEIKDILKTIYQIGHTTGARHSFFKHFEGKKGDFVCALYDVPEKNLRLYCMRFGMVAIILGSGGEKPKHIRAWQDDDKLLEEANTMIDYARDILQRLDDGDLYWSNDGHKLQGKLNNNNNE